MHERREAVAELDGSTLHEVATELCFLSFEDMNKI